MDGSPKEKALVERKRKEAEDVFYSQILNIEGIPENILVLADITEKYKIKFSDFLDFIKKRDDINEKLRVAIMTC